MSTGLLHQIGSDMKYREWHINDDNMIMYIYHGDGAVVCEDRQFNLCDGALVFIGQRKHHYTMPETKELYERSKIFISSVDFDRVLNNLPDSVWLKKTFTSDSFVYAVIPENERAIVESLYDEIQKYDSDRNYSDIIFVCNVLKLLFYLHKNIIQNVSLSYGPIYKAIAYINENIFEDITVDSICAVVHMSKYHFCRIFKKHTRANGYALYS